MYPLSKTRKPFGKIVVTQRFPKERYCIYIFWSVISGKLSLCCVFVSSLFLWD